MKIGVIGTGNMGRALGVRLAGAGHDVMFGARRPEQAAAAAEQAAGTASSGTTDEAAAFGEALIWTMRESDPAKVLQHPAALDGKVVIDINNRDFANELRGGAWFEQAIAECFQANAPGARIVKAFNVTPQEAFDTDAAALRSAGAQIFIAGDDAEAKKIVTALAADLGFATVDLGSGAVAMRAVEALGDVIRLLIAGEYGMRAHLRLTTLPEPTLPSAGGRQPSSYN